MSVEYLYAQLTITTNDNVIRNTMFVKIGMIEFSHSGVQSQIVTTLPVVETSTISTPAELVAISSTTSVTSFCGQALFNLTLYVV
jgi:hypothetical protein